VNSNPYYLVRLLHDYGQSSYSLTESIALEQTALAHIINAEGEKIQAAAAHGTVDQMLAVNDSVADTINAVAQLAMVLQQKQEVIQCQVVNNLNC
ncbi:MAG: hypothetical protein RRX95_01960, partial [Oscillospiraceae bacterium]